MNRSNQVLRLLALLILLLSLPMAARSQTLQSIAVTPINPYIPIGGIQQFTATGTYSDMSTQDLTSTATWSSSATGVATINSTGLASAAGYGQTTIQATSGSINGSTTLTVTARFVSTGGMNAGRAFHTATMLNSGKVLVTGGENPTDGFLSSAGLYDPAPNGTFTFTGSMSVRRDHHTATLLNNGMVLITGGYSDGNVVLSSAELYDPAGGPNGTGAFAATKGLMTVARTIHTATLLNNGMVLIAGGESGTAGTEDTSAELYDPATETFAPIMSSMSVSRPYHTATLLNNGMVLIAGGDNNSNNVSTAELYNPATGTFGVPVSMTALRRFHTATLLNNGMVLITGGTDPGNNPESSAELYDPTAGTFTAVTNSMTAARYDHTATLLNNGMVLIAGGAGAVNDGDILSSAELYDPSKGTFTATGSMTDARYVDTATLLNNGMVLIAGGGGGHNSFTTAEVYEPATLTPVGLVSITVSPANASISPGSTQQFTATGTFSDSSTQTLVSATWSSSNTAVASISNDAGNHGLALALSPGTTTITASAGSVTNTATLTVTGTPVGFALTGSMNTGRVAHTATMLNSGKVLIAGGANGSSVLSSAYLYDPAFGTFAVTGSMAAARKFHTATLLNNGKVLITGGSNDSGFLSSAELYDPASGTFADVGSMNAARYLHRATLLNNGKVLITGGYSGGPILSSAELYIPATGTNGSFTATGSMTAARLEPTATMLNNGKVLIAGGISNGNVVLSSAELYDPAAAPNGTFTATGSMSTARYLDTATLLNNGMVLITGGSNSVGGTVSITAELYDPTAKTNGAFTAVKNSMTAPRQEHTATLLNNGMVLIAGGADQNNVNLSSAELYDPAAAPNGTFDTAGSMTAARILDTATLLNNGMVLITGGSDNSGNGLSSAEVYEPATLTPTGLISIAVTPLTASISPSMSQQFIATGTFSDNSTQTLQSATWSSSNTSIATISNDSGNHGVAAALTPGTTTITASAGSVTNTATLTVTGAAVKRRRGQLTSQ